MPLYNPPVLPAAVYCKAFRAAAYSAADNSERIIGLTGEEFDSGTLHDNATNPHLITIPTTGYYLVNAQVTWASGTTGTRRASVWLNQTAAHDNAPTGGTRELSQAHATATTGSPVINISGLLYLVASDTLSLSQFHNQGTAINVNATNTWLSVVKVAP